MSKVSKRPTVLMPSAAEDKVTTAAAKSDPGSTATYTQAVEGNGSTAVVTWPAKI